MIKKRKILTAGLMSAALMMSEAASVAPLSMLSEVKAEVLMNGTYGSVATWTLEDDGTLTISGNGSLDSFLTGSNSQGNYWGDFKNYVKSVIVGEGITSLGKYCFNGCTAITSITLPSTLTSIGVGTFNGCTNLASLSIPSGVTSIGSTAFAGCTKIQSLTIPNGVTTIGSDAFKNTTALNSLDLSKTTITAIGSNAFLNSGITSISLPGTVTSIGSQAFSGCSKLTSLTLPATLKVVSASMLKNCTGLTTLTIPDGVQTISDEALSGCTGLTSLVLPASVTTIGDKALAGCTGLKSLTIAAETCNIGTDVLSGTSGDLKVTASASVLAQLGFGTPSSSTNVNNDITEGVVYSYVEDNSDGGITRIEFISATDGVTVENYNVDGSFVDKKSIAALLPKFGGYFRGSDGSHYIVFGQDNEEESSTAEVLCVAKYDSNWNLVGSDTVSGSNIRKPFSGGSCRMTESGGYLYVRMAFQPYKYNDGNSTDYVQGAMTMTFNESTQTLTEVYTDITNTDYGYMTNSFNQFVITDASNNIITLDHGNYQPNGAYLGKFTQKGGASKLIVTTGNTKPMTGFNTVTYQGTMLNTGATVGGLNYSSSGYITIGTSVDQSHFSDTAPQNVYVTYTPSSSFSAGSTTFKFLTGYEAGTVSVPHLVKVSNNQFMVMWTYQLHSQAAEVLYYTFIDGTGTQTSEIYSSTVTGLSDCQPTLIGDKVIWYNTSSSLPKYYCVEMDDPSTVKMLDAVSINSCKITLSQTEYEYDGEEKKPTVKVVYDKTTLVEGTDYVLTYKNNIDPGTATVTVTGQGSYGGSRDLTFTIKSNAIDIAEATATLSYTEVEADGTEKKPTVTVTYQGATLTKGTDYTVSYLNNVEAGTATVVITGKGDFQGTKTLTFTITEAAAVVDISTGTLTLASSTYTYDGTAKKPGVTVKVGTTTLNSSDYTVSYSSNVNAGTATVKVTGKGSYTGTLTKTFTINPQTLSETTATFTLAKTSYTYDGTAKTPAPTVKVGTTTLTSGTDYTVSYTNNTQVGTASCTITGEGNYTGTMTKTFAITAPTIADATVVLEETSYTYDGTAKTPAVTVTLSGKTLVKGTDYTVTYTNNTEVGTATVTITGVEGHYSGSKSVTFTITKAIVSLADATVVLTPASYTYDGTAKKPAVTVTLDNKTLTKGTDYTVSYVNNTNAGTATVTVTGTGDYTGSASKTFTIAKAAITNAVVTPAASSVSYSGQAQTPSVTVTLGTKTLTSSDYTVSYENNVNVGTATITVTGKENYSGTASATFKITAASIGTATVTLSENTFAYDGSAKTPTPTVTLSGKTLVKDTDYTVEYFDYIEAGQATITITGAGNYTGSKSVSYNITKASLNSAVVTLAEDTYTYDGKAKQPGVTVSLGGKALSASSDYEVVYTDNINAGEATITVTGKGNYSGTVSKTFTITAASLQDASISLSVSTFTYDGKAKEPVVTVIMGKTLTKGTDYTVSYSDNVNAGTATVTITGIGNYQDEVNKTYTIKKAVIADADVTLTKDTYSYTGSAIIPDVTVTVSGKTLVKGTDYEVTATGNTEVGEAGLTIAGKGNYEGSVEKTFTIEACALTDAVVTMEKTTWAYTGEELTPAVTVTVSGKTLTEADYDLSYSGNVEAGQATVIVSGKGNYTGEKTGSFTITEAEITADMVSLVSDTVAYTGEARTPEVTVNFNGKVLKVDQDFTVAYENNTEEGEATVTVTGTGNFTGSVSKTFQITKDSLSDATVVVAEGTYTYDGEEHKPAVTVTLGGKNLTENVDYTLSYENNVHAGEAKAVITGTGSYTGAAEAAFTISAADIAKAAVVLGDEALTYDGTEKEAVITSVTLPGGLALSAADYEVSYTGNINAGTATVTITASGDFTGEVSTTFTIAQASLTGAVVSTEEDSYAYTGQAVTPAVSVTLNGEVLPEEAYDVSYSGNDKAGTATVTVTGKDNYKDTATGTFTITNYSLNAGTLTVAEKKVTYTGEALTPAVSVFSAEGVELKKDVDYALTYENNVNVGTATVTVEGRGEYSGSLSDTFTIEAAIIDSLTVSDVTYNGEAQEPEVTVKAGDLILSADDYTVNYSDNTNAGSATVSVTATGGNFSGTLSTSFTIEQASLTEAAVGLSYVTVVADGTEKTPDVVVTLEGKGLTADDYTVTYEDNTAVGTAKVTVSGKGNYTGFAYAYFDITEAPVIRLAGDADGDGQVTILDVTLIRQFVLGYDVEINLSNADVDGDGYVSMGDAMKIRDFLLGNATLE